jgi:hypothetical protein
MYEGTVYNHETQMKTLQISARGVPDMRAGCGLEPERNGVSLGEGGEGGPGHTESWEDKQSMLSSEGGNKEKKEGGRASRA